MAKSIAAPGPEILEAALLGLETQREKLEAQIAQVRLLLGQKAGTHVRRILPQTASSGAAEAVNNGSGHGRRELSPAARKRIAAAQKKRWAAFRKNKK